MRQGALQAADEVEALIVSNRAEVKAVKVHPEALVAPTVDGALPLAGAAAPAGEAFYIQMGAFSRAEKAAEVRDRVTSRGWVSGAMDVVRAGSLHRLLSGPFATRDAALEAARSLPATLGLKPIVIKR